MKHELFYSVSDTYVTSGQPAEHAAQGVGLGAATLSEVQHLSSRESSTAQACPLPSVTIWDELRHGVEAAARQIKNLENKLNPPAEPDIAIAR